MVVFLAFRFAIGSFANGLKFGAGAGIALFHDIIITVGFFALMGVLAGWPVDSLFLTACLGLLGLSLLSQQSRLKCERLLYRRPPVEVAGKF